jgi:hypothetical protein
MTLPNKPGPKPKQIVTGEIEGIQCGWDKTVVPPEQVYDLAVLGLTNKEIGRFYNVNENTIARNFVAELQKGREMTKIKLRRAMMHNACTNHNAAVQIFLAKAVLGMSETGSSENTVLPWNEADTDIQITEDNTDEESTQQPTGQ